MAVNNDSIFPENWTLTVLQRQPPLTIIPLHPSNLPPFLRKSRQLSRALGL